MLPNISCVYSIHSPCGAIYVGGTRKLRARWAQHKCMLRLDTHFNAVLRAACVGHPVRSFRVEILEECCVDDLAAREQHWIDMFRRSGVVLANSDGPADNPMRGMHHTENAKKKIGEASRSRPRSAEHNRRIGDAHKGKEMSDATKHKLRAAKLGKPCPWLLGDKNPSYGESHRLRMRERNPAREPEVRLKISETLSKPVVDAATRDRWASVSACANALGVSVAAVSAHLTGKNKSCKGRKLVFAES